MDDTRQKKGAPEAAEDEMVAMLKDLSSKDQYLKELEQNKSHRAKEYIAGGKAAELLKQYTDVFQCKQCGSCCEDLVGGSVKSEDLQKLGDQSSVVSLNTNGLFLFSWEAKKLRKLANGAHVQLDIVPHFGYFSKKLGTIFIHSYLLRNKVCPFLSPAKQCQIYLNRPLTCQKYPIIQTAFDGHVVQLSKCTQKVRFIEAGTSMELDRQALFQKFYELYGETFLAAIRSDFYQDTLELAVSACYQQGVLPLENFLPKHSRQIQTYKQLDLWEFLGQHGWGTVEDLNHHVNRLMNDFLRELFRREKKQK